MIKVKEVGLKNTETRVNADGDDLYGLLENIYGENVNLFINANGDTSGYINIYVNKFIVKNVKEIPVSDGDEVIILTSMSGG